MVKQGEYSEEFKEWVAMLAVKRSDEDPRDLHEGQSEGLSQAF